MMWAIPTIPPIVDGEPESRAWFLPIAAAVTIIWRTGDVLWRTIRDKRAASATARSDSGGEETQPLLKNYTLDGTGLEEFEGEGAVKSDSILQKDGWWIVGLRLTRLVCVCGLLVLAIREVVIDDGQKLLDIVLLLFYIYVGILSSISIAGPDYWRKATSQDASFSLFVAFLVYFFRDVWTYAIAIPVQTHLTDSVSWIRFTLLALSGFVVPLSIPQASGYGMSGVDGEEIHSLFSRMTFSYLNGIVFFAARIPKVSMDDLPPLWHSLTAVALAKQGMANFDRLIVGDRYIFWGMLRTYRYEYFWMCFWLIPSGAATFLGPYAMKNLLRYLERKDSSQDTTFLRITLFEQEVFLEPWFWIIVLSTAPLLTSIIYNRWMYNQTLVQVKVEGLLSQVVFEHALRMRLNTPSADPEKKEKKIANVPAVPAIQATQEVVPTATVGGAPAAQEPLSSVPDAQPESGALTASSSSETLPAMQSGQQTPTSVTQSVSSTAPSKPSAPAPEDKKPPASAPIGKINNLLTSDLNRMKLLHIYLTVPSSLYQIVLAIMFLYSLLGWSALVGLAVLVVGIPAAAAVGKVIMSAQKKTMEITDQRVQTMTETLQILRTLKLLAWEAPMTERISQKREAELKWILYGKILDVTLSNIEGILPLISMLATFGSFTLIMKQPLDAARAFPALSVFNVLQDQLQIVMYRIPDAFRVKVTMDRYNDFLNKTEILVQEPLLQLPSAESTRSAGGAFIPAEISNENRIGLNKATFTWNKPAGTTSEGPGISSHKTFKLRCEGEILFQRGKINLVVGPTASGKTSLLMALLGEMYYTPLEESSWYQLPKDGGVAYAPQESWVLNATVKENILFNKALDEERYRNVLKLCALERDLSLWEAGDLTEVGEKGLTLSGGQKARVTLARALYSDASIVLLDDPLAALDVHTARYVVDNALRGDLVKGRTIILVTHNIPLAAPIADHLITLDKRGRVTSQGSITEAMQRDPDLKALVDQKAAEIEAEDVQEGKDETKAGSDSKKKGKTAGKLIVKEEKAMGRVEWAAIKLFIDGIGGSIAWFIVVFLDSLYIVAYILETWYIGFWSSQYDDSEAEVSDAKYLGYYALISVMNIVFSSACYAFWSYRSIHASRSIHQRLLKSVFNAPLRWLDTVPIGRITTRCTQDINAIDSMISGMSYAVIVRTMMLFALFITTVVMTGLPAFVSGLLAAGLGGWVGLIYLKAQLSVKREMSNAKSPILSQVGTAVSGIVVIRAFGAQPYFRRELNKRVNAYSRVSRVFYDMNRWVALRIDMLGAIFSAAVASFLVYAYPVGASALGFTLSMVISFNRQILQWVRLYNMLEIQANSLERVLDFLRIDQEPQPVESGKPPAYWPSSGDLQVENLSASYSDDGPVVLRNISFHIKAGERVGIVGRTGAGKSSITLALLRAIPTKGKIYYDNIPTDDVNLNALRSNITLIPQQPELIRGTLRENLDPAGEYNDADLHDALRSAGLYNLRGAHQPVDESVAESDGHAVIGLDASVESGGTNLSLGQRQIVALARAILRRSKILILDEATAAIDYETDSAIQHSLRTELSKDTTVITIAHRLQTIMDSDKILVLDAGEIAEFDSPSNLLKKKDGFLRALVERSDDKLRLMGLAGVQLTDL